MSFQFVESTPKERIGYVTLNRPDKRNALNYLFLKELKQALEMHENNPEVKVIILKANGTVFCAGADLEYMRKLQDYSYHENHLDSTHMAEFYKYLYTLKKVVIAQVMGHAIGSGCSLATVCDFVFSVPEAQFGFSEVKMGFIPSIAMVFLVRRIGEARARELLLTGDLISANHAHSIGLINDIIPAGEIEEEVEKFARRMCEENSTVSLEFTKKMMNDVQKVDFEKALDFAAKMDAHTRSTGECKDAIDAFLRKEKKTW